MVEVNVMTTELFFYKFMLYMTKVNISLKALVLPIASFKLCSNVAYFVLR